MTLATITGQNRLGNYDNRFCSSGALFDCARHLSVFFLDEDQHVTWWVIETEGEIRQRAKAIGAEISSDAPCTGGHLLMGLELKEDLQPERHRDPIHHYNVEQANKANGLRSTIAAPDLPNDQPEGFRQKAVSFCLQVPSPGLPDPHEHETAEA